MQPADGGQAPLSYELQRHHKGEWGGEREEGGTGGAEGGGEEKEVCVVWCSSSLDGSRAVSKNVSLKMVGHKQSGNYKSQSVSQLVSVQDEPLLL